MIIELRGYELQALLQEITPTDGISVIRFDTREDGIAIKVNEAMWSPTMGTVVNRD
ncbi:hypothetical protein AB0K16_22165 [Nonomuraea jabiensis]|uniref:hypothetical protein n=1 Tax=Nonomuraea jabiensis TaxID=882448 RepID=UPI0034323BFA